MRQTRSGGATAWVHAVISPIVGAIAVLMLGVDWFDATTAGAIAVAVALIGLIKESQLGDASRRRTFHLAGLLLGLGAAVCAQTVPGLFQFALL